MEQPNPLGYGEHTRVIVGLPMTDYEVWQKFLAARAPTTCKIQMKSGSWSLPERTSNDITDQSIRL